MSRRLHRPMVYCSDGTPSVYAGTYGWWCLDCTATRDADTGGATKNNADRDAKKHVEREAALFDARAETLAAARERAESSHAA